ncbi:MAG: SUMF1/EgtB/PvdO family nonheme iron enzyme [Thermoanaerobaculia bacterium]
MPRPIRWLHLSDLHYGCPGKELWEQVEPEFRRDVERMLEECDAPDLLLFTGDLAFSGQADEYAEVDRFLDDLLELLTKSGAREPLILPVPGNHDLRRPRGKDARACHVLRAFGASPDDPLVAEISAELWKDRDASFIEPLFPGYRIWFEQRIRQQLEKGAEIFHRSHFPCDFTVEVEPKGAFRLAVVALNSTWIQYDDGDFDGHLLVPLQQLRAALASPDERKPYEVFERCDQSLLLMHQPPQWLCERGRQIFDGEIYPGGRFTLCLYGHMHEPDSRFRAEAGGKPRAFFQSPSLFGLEKWGTSGETRAFGVTWGQLRADGEVRIWPRERKLRGDGSWSFGIDGFFHEDPDGVVIRLGEGQAEETPAAETRGFDRRAYLDAVIGAHDSMEIRGIVTGSEQAIRPPIENLYTPLACRELGGLLGEAHGGAQVNLTAVLTRSKRILIEGQPGAGKTTFLRLVACMLARDARGVPCPPGGGSWRQNHLGLEVNEKQPAPIPVFLRLAGLVSLFAESDADDDRRRLLDLLQLDVRRAAGFDRRFFEERLEDGSAWLLLDGLDEVADLEIRDRVFAVVRDAITAWRAPMVIASRPIRTEELRKLGFLVATVEPFGDSEIRRFLKQWVAALHQQDPERALRGEAGKYLPGLEEAILTRPQVRLLATNPVMLTSLAVVHWNQGELPEGRARVYRAVIHWLLRARAPRRRQELGLEPDFVERSLAALALWAMTHDQGKQVVFELDRATAAVLPALERERPDDEPTQQEKLARRWLLFESEGSGVVEELPGGRLRFWHLTFQEYLAALELARPREDRDWWPILRRHLDDAQWRETVELFATCLYDLGHPERVDRLLREVLAMADADDLTLEARVVGIIGRLLPSVEVCGYKAGPDIRSAWQEARERTMAIFTIEGARQVPVELRITAAEALGQGGDPRLAPGVDNFFEVPGLDVSLGKYPVTVEEYQRFVDGRGYEKRRYWDDAGWQAKEGERWSTPDRWSEQLKTPNRPVIFVSWFEAYAYCRWLSEQSGRTVRLPAEAEWRQAATSGDSPYPWGADEPDAERANFAPDWNPNVGRPTPVGIYPLGNGPYRHCDLGGNTWEWCSDPSEPKADEMALRGGGWGSLAVILRAAIGSRCHAARRTVDVGFRVLAAPAST